MIRVHTAARGLIAVLCVIATIGCSGEISLDSSLAGDDAGPPTASPDGSTVDGADGGQEPGATTDPDGGAEQPGPEVVGIPNPNTLDQERLFTCEEAEAASSPERIRRLMPGQYLTRFVPGYGVVPYGHDERFRYTTDASDARMDDAAADQLLLYASKLGQQAAGRRISWGYCMRQSTLDQRGVEQPTRECLEGWATTYLKRAWQRDPTVHEVASLVDYSQDVMDRYGTQRGLELTAARPFLAPEFLFKTEIGAGNPDIDGRKRLSSWETAQAITAALTDAALVRWYYTRDNDEHLYEALDAIRAAAEADELQTREQVEAQVRALLQVPLPMVGEPQRPVLPTNIERFFRDYLGHPEASFVFKNGGELPREAQYIYYGPGLAVDSMDQTLAYLYRRDSDFLREMLTTRQWFVPLSREFGWVFNLHDGNDATPESTPPGMQSMPEDQRAGVLTHPAWLIAHSKNQHTEPHPVHRGKWIYENILCGTIPQLPITVDAKLVDAPTLGVRERLETTTGPEADGGFCWSCHKMMDPLGIPFETYDHYGRYREQEKVGDGSLVPVDAATTLVSTGDPALDGQPVANAVELVELLAGSERVEGCFVRNTFRYFMRRAETYEDACTLTQMREAYRESDGSFQEMLVTLLTSDTFLYRHAMDEAQP